MPGELHAQRSLADYSPWGHKESNMTEGLIEGDREKKRKRERGSGTSLVVQQLGLGAFTAKGLGSIPGRSYMLCGVAKK